MPKIIPNARENLIEEARNQIEVNGYDSVTIRSIARGCQIGLGTFYNYFKSKDVLIATYLLEEWEQRVERINAQAEFDIEPMQLVKIMHDELNGFMKNNMAVFTAADAQKAFSTSIRTYHNMLIEQMSAPLFAVCERCGYENAKFLSQFVAEAILTWTIAKKDYDEIASIICKLFVK